MDKIKIPNYVSIIIDRLIEHGFEAYVVGGCVRDSLLGLEPHDWDICTPATPDEMIHYLSGIHGHRYIETGLKHGTVTIGLYGEWCEVTTFRIDGDYSDQRHPDSVTFTSSLHSDLSRRDFTMNAMAYNDLHGLVDPFGGRQALERNEISCVGNPEDRFREDPLRIMRALRFASTYGFGIETDTAFAISYLRENLRKISVERIQSELCRLLMGKNVLHVLLEYSDVIATIIPELAPSIGFNQNNPYHQYTIYDHIAHAVANYTGDDLSVKVALLLHDIGKPQCYTEDERGGHFYGHGVPSRDLAETVMKRLRFDNKTKDEVLTLVLYHDAVIEPTPRVVRRWLNKIGEERFRQLLCVRMADIKAHTEGTQQSRIERCLALGAILEEVIAEEQCFSMKDLAINGTDVMSLGVPEGQLVGEILSHVLDMVINGELQNEHDALIEEAQKYMNNKNFKIEGKE